MDLVFFILSAKRGLPWQQNKPHLSTSVTFLLHYMDPEFDSLCLLTLSSYIKINPSVFANTHLDILQWCHIMNTSSFLSIVPQHTASSGLTWLAVKCMLGDLKRYPWQPLERRSEHVQGGCSEERNVEHLRNPFTGGDAVQKTIISRVFSVEKPMLRPSCSVCVRLSTWLHDACGTFLKNNIELEW